MDSKAPFALTQEHSDVINALLPKCKYVVGIRKNETGEVRFCPENLDWNEETSLGWWAHGNMSCDCNRDLMFHRQTKPEYDEDTPCGEIRYTVVGIWFPDGDDIRDLYWLNDLENFHERTKVPGSHNR
jgi:hypothetical protein